ncbi:hypothetical protein ACQHIV_23005 [Kribbella sp. GL6]|uniref:hypothetical protein n=1 Tax=Kribbella sp. GL6 TaxID=3419765 RepID=UPI003D05B44C
MSDVWDNNTRPFVGAAVARGVRRTELSESGIRWMADLGAERRHWVLEQAAAAGCQLTLPASSAPGGVFRDYAGLVRPAQVPLTPAVAEQISGDYDLASAQIQGLLVERSAGRLAGALAVSVDRRFEIDDGEAGAAALDLRFEGIDELRFDLGDSVGIAFGDALTVGETGVLRADRARAWIDDSWWHLSSAGKAADAQVPVARPARPPDPDVGPIRGTAALAAVVLQRAMLEIRMVRYPSYADVIPVHRIAQAFQGAGSAVLAAGSLRWRREAAFRRLIEHWIAVGGAELSRFFHDVLAEIANDEYSSRARRRLARSLCPEAVDVGTSAGPTAGDAVLVDYRAAVGPHVARLVLQHAVPVGGRWALNGVGIDEPGTFVVGLGSGRLVVRT